LICRSSRRNGPLFGFDGITDVQIDRNGGEGTGNPALDPWRSTNYGASLEYYLNPVSMVDLDLVWPSQEGHASFSERSYTVGVRGQW
jgi:hypothetical protein